MFVLLPVILLLFSSLLMLILQRSREGFGYAWVISLGATLLAWGAIVWMHWKPPAPLEFKDWVAVKDASGSLAFQLDLITWPYAASLAAVALAVILTDTARLQGITSVWEWAGSLALTGTGLLAVMAGTPFTLAITWMVVDLIDLVFVLSGSSSRSMTIQSVFSFAARAGGTFFILLGAIAARSQGLALTLTNIPPSTGTYLFIGAGLRLGVFPIHPPYVSVPSLRRGFGTLLRLVSPASSLMLLSHLPQNPVSTALTPVFTFLTVVVVVYAALMWFQAGDELNGRPFWLLALAGLAMLCVLRGQPSASITWGITLLLSGALIFLFSARAPGLVFIPLLAGINLLGLPFSPSAGGWPGLVRPFTPSSFFAILAVFLLAYGYFRYAVLPGERLSSLERWAKPVYPLGLLFLIATHWVIGIWGLPGSITPGIWWAGLIPLALSAVAIAWARRADNREAPEGQSNPVGLLQVASTLVWKPLSSFFFMGWFYRLLGWLFMFLGRLVNFLSLVLEGDGGVLWAFLFLALLISLISAGGKP
jgi:hypothetical protein